MDVLRFAAGVVGIATLLALQALIIVGGAYVVLLALRHLPMIGRRHRHAHWNEWQKSAPPGAKRT